MHLIYVDESGNTGCNLDDIEQPLFLLGALVVPVDSWQKLEMDLIASLGKHFPNLVERGDEVHGTDIRNGSGPFKGIYRDLRMGLRDEWIGIAKSHKLKFVCRSIVKKRFQKSIPILLGSGIKLNPYIAAFPLVATVINECLAKQNSLGLFISDENDEIARDIEKLLRSLRLTNGPLKLSQIIEKGFFIESSKSRVLQLCDLFALYARKSAESKECGKILKEPDLKAAKEVDSMTTVGNEKFLDVIEWLKQQHGSKKNSGRG